MIGLIDDEQSADVTSYGVFGCLGAAGASVRAFLGHEIDLVGRCGRSCEAGAQAVGLLDTVRGVRSSEGWLHRYRQQDLPRKICWSCGSPSH